MEVVSVQYLRGFAAMMIVFFHLELQLHRLGYQGYWPHFLYAGVDVFFVISGFIMWITTARGMTTAEFYRRRIIRICPLYWLLTTVVLGILIFHPNAVQSGRFDSLHILASYLFLPAVHPVTGTMEPLLIPGWTLNYEMFFYAIFGVCLMLPNRSRLLLASAFLFGLAATPLVTNISPVSIVGFYTYDIILEFAFGMALGWVYLGGAKLLPPFAWATLLVGAVAVVILSGMPHRGLVTGVPALLIVGGAVMIERFSAVPNIRSLRLLGNASYSLYLSHTIVLSAVEQLWQKFNLHLSYSNLFFFGCVAVTSAVGAGILIYLFIEVQILWLGNLRIMAASTK